MTKEEHCKYPIDIGNLACTLEDKMASKIQVLAIQLELDNEQLAEWREKWHLVSVKDNKSRAQE